MLPEWVKFYTASDCLLCCYGGSGGGRFKTTTAKKPLEFDSASTQAIPIKQTKKNPRELKLEFTLSNVYPLQISLFGRGGCFFSCLLHSPALSSGCGKVIKHLLYRLNFFLHVCLYQECI